MKILLGGTLNMSSMELSEREIAVAYAWSFIGTPYKWGGNDPMAGFDCSGFCIEVLQAVGVLSRHGDWTAANLFEKFKEKKVNYPTQGCLVFWNNQSGNKIVHVELCINDRLALGASGGGSRTVTVQDAIEQDAYIKLRPFASRPNIAGFVNPFLR